MWITTVQTATADRTSLFYNCSGQITSWQLVTISIYLISRSNIQTLELTNVLPNSFAQQLVVGAGKCALKAQIRILFNRNGRWS